MRLTNMALAACFLLPACGGGDDTSGQPSADQREKLDNIARRLEQEQGTFDTSPDSMVPAEGGALAVNGAQPDAATPSAPAALANGANVAGGR